MQLLDYFVDESECECKCECECGGVVLVFEFMPSGLWEILHDLQRPCSIGELKAYMLMLLKGLQYLHERGIMHRVSCQLLNTTHEKIEFFSSAFFFSAVFTSLETNVHLTRYE